MVLWFLWLLLLWVLWVPWPLWNLWNLSLRFLQYFLWGRCPTDQWSLYFLLIL